MTEKEEKLQLVEVKESEKNYKPEQKRFSCLECPYPKNMCHMFDCNK
jgi:hypothetical protein